MTISNEAIKTTVFGNGVQTTFSYNFLIPSAATAKLFLLDTVTGDSVLLPAASWSLSGAGNPAGGTFTYPRGVGADPASSTQTLTLLRDVPNTQNTNLANQNGYYPRAVEGALDWIVMQVQQFVDETSRSLRVPAQEQGFPPLPPATLRANTVQAYDSSGLPVLLPLQPDNNTSVIAQGGVTARTLAARFADMVNVLDYGAVPDWNGTAGTDNTAAFAAAFAYAALERRMVFVPYGDFFATGALWLQEGALGIMMQGTLFSPGGFVALTLGGNSATRNQNKIYGPVRVLRTTQSNWLSENDIGVRIWNADNCVCIIERAERFTINVQLASDLRGVEDSDFHYGRIIDGKVGVDLRTFNPGPTSYVNSCRHFGGHFACSSASNPGTDRFGVRLSANNPATDYILHNAHVFYGPAFELQVIGGHLAIPFLMEVDGRGVQAHAMRMEACSQHAAWHTRAMNDCTYEVNFVGTFGPFVNVLYTGATRAGGTVVMRHQTAAAVGAPRLVAAADSLRAIAYLEETVSAGGVGFERMAAMSGNPSGAPTTLNTLCFPGLTLVTPTGDGVTIPTSRAVGFVLDLDNPATPFGIQREVALQVEGTDVVGIVAQFNASETALGAGSPILWSNANAVYNGNTPNDPYWWETNVPLDQLSGGYPLFMWQRVTFHPAARYAFVGVRGGSGTANLRALRLFGSALYAPQVIYGGPRSWGLREITRSYALDPVSIPAGGAIASPAPVAFAGARASYFTQVTFQEEPNIQPDNEFIAWTASVRIQGAAGTMRWRATNSGPAAVDLGAGTLRIRQIKPRL